MCSRRFCTMHRFHPRLLDPAIPADLERICLKCLAKSETDRYPHVAGLAAELRSFLARSRAALRSISLAVLPFLDADAEAAPDYFCEGVTEELINRLAHIRNLRLVSHAAVRHFRSPARDIRAIGNDLHVDALLEGQCSPNRYSAQYCRPPGQRGRRQPGLVRAV